MGELPAWMSPEAAKRRQNRSSARQEAGRAREIGGRVQPGSGSSWRARGDVKTDTHLEELKETQAESFPLKAEMVEEHMRRAAVQGKEARIVIEFKREDGSRRLRLIVEPG